MNVFIGIDIGGTTINIGFVSENRQILAESSLPTKPEAGPGQAIVRINEELERLMNKTRDSNVFAAIGIGMPGLLDIENGCIIEAANLPGWQNFKIASTLKKYTGIPVFIENDANLAALGEYWLGSGQGADSLFMVTLGTGIGGALLSQGRLVRFHPSAGEFGHMIIDKNGVICTCGRKGCLETYVSKHGMVRLARKWMQDDVSSALRQAGHENITPQVIADAAVKGDQLALKIFEEAGDALGVALSNLINLTGVTCIIIGGGIANSLELLRKPVMESLEKNVFKSIFSSVNVFPAALGEKAGFVGAARLAADCMGVL